MTFSGLKKFIEEKFAELEEELAGLPTPKVNDRDCPPEYIWEYGQKVGMKDALTEVLSKWPAEKKLYG